MTRSQLRSIPTSYATIDYVVCAPRTQRWLSKSTPGTMRFAPTALQRGNGLVASGGGDADGSGGNREQLHVSRSELSLRPRTIAGEGLLIVMLDYQVFEAGNVILQSGLTYRNARLAYKT